MKAVDDANKIIKEGREVKLYNFPRKEAEKLFDPERTRLDMTPSFIKEIRFGEIKVLKTLSKGKTQKS